MVFIDWNGSLSICIYSLNYEELCLPGSDGITGREHGDDLREWSALLDGNAVWNIPFARV